MVNEVRLKFTKEDTFKRIKRMVLVSKLYYIHNLGQELISEKLCIPKYMVRRLLREAREQGIIKINIADPKVKN